MLDRLPIEIAKHRYAISRATHLTLTVAEGYGPGRRRLGRGWTSPDQTVSFAISTAGCLCILRTGSALWDRFPDRERPEIRAFVPIECTGTAPAAQRPVLAFIRT